MGFSRQGNWSGLPFSSPITYDNGSQNLSQPQNLEGLLKYRSLGTICRASENLCVCTCSVVSDSFATPWTVAGQVSLSMGFFRHTRGALGSHAQFSQRGVSSTPPCRGSAASLPHVVPSAGHQPAWKPAGAGVTQPSPVFTFPCPGGRASRTYTHHVRRLVSRAQVCPLSLFRTLTFKIWGPQGCQTALWPWDARDVVPARGLSSQLSACLSVWPQEEPGASFCLLTLGPHLEQGSPP